MIHSNMVPSCFFSVFDSLLSISYSDIHYQYHEPQNRMHKTSVTTWGCSSSYKWIRDHIYIILYNNMWRAYIQTYGCYYHGYTHEELTSTALPSRVKLCVTAGLWDSGRWWFWWSSIPDHHLKIIWMIMTAK
jgi:hypothetical protein